MGQDSILFIRDFQGDCKLLLQEFWEQIIKEQRETRHGDELYNGFSSLVDETHDFDVHPMIYKNKTEAEEIIRKTHKLWRRAMVVAYRINAFERVSNEQRFMREQLKRSLKLIHKKLEILKMQERNYIKNMIRQINNETLEIIEDMTPECRFCQLKTYITQLHEYDGWSDDGFVQIAPPDHERVTYRCSHCHRAQAFTPTCIYEDIEKYTHQLQSIRTMLDTCGGREIAFLIGGIAAC